jgi:hypothetical protein
MATANSTLGSTLEGKHCDPFPLHLQLWGSQLLGNSLMTEVKDYDPIPFGLEEFVVELLGCILRHVDY